MRMEKHYDVVVIGSGQGGGPLAHECAKAGRQTLLIEMESVGGTCINRGCTPTKTMIASGKAAFEAKRTKLFGVDTSFHSVDMKAVRKRKDEIVDNFRSSSQKKMEKEKNLTLVFGVAKFIDKTHLEIATASETETISFSLAFINSGGRPNIPSIDGLSNVSYLDSTTIMQLNYIPKHLIAIGAGYISLEFGQLFRRLGSEVTLLEPSERLVKREDPDISDTLKEILTEDGIHIHFKAQVEKVEQKKGSIFVDATVDGEKITLEGSDLLVGAGRTPNTEELQLGKAGIEVDKKGYIKTNDKLQTSIPHIYAIGDVKGGPAFTHISYDDYRVLRDNLLKGKDSSIKNRLIPYTVYTDPQLGCVGLKEAEAKEKKIPIKVAKMPMSYVARAIETDNTRGMMKVIVHAETDAILGCSILGVEGGELMSMIEIAILGKLPYQKLQEGIFAHPTLAEAFNNIFSKLE